MKRKNLLNLLLVIMMTSLLAFGLVACNNNPDNNVDNSGNQANVTVSFKETEITLAIGDSKIVRATTDPSGIKVTYSSSDESVATVSVIGKVEAKKAGEATITATAGAGKASFKVKVIDVTVSLDKQTATINIIESNTLQLTATDSEGINKYTWKSSDESIATVDANGLVTAKSGGVVTITASIGSVSASCVVTVTTPGDYYTLNSGNNADVAKNPGKWYYYTSVPSGVVSAYHADEKAYLSVKDGKDSAYYLRYTPENLADYNAGSYINAEVEITLNISAFVRLGTSDSKYQKQVVECAAGTYRLTFKNVKVEDGLVLSVSLCKSLDPNDYLGGTYTLSCSTPVLSQGIGISSSSVSLAVGESEELSVLGTSETPSWETSNPSVADVDSNGKVSAIGVGNCDIIATVGGNTATCQVTVVLKRVTLNKKQLILKTDGIATETLNAEVSDGAAPHFSSSNGSVATVDDTGKVTALSAGYTVITVESDGVTDTCDVFVVNDSLKDMGTKEALETSNSNNMNTNKNPGVWFYNNKVFATYSMLNGVITLNNDSEKEAKTSQTMLRVLPKYGEEAMSGRFAFIATISNNNTMDINEYSINVNGQSSASYRSSLASGETETFCAVLEITDPATEFVNLKISPIHGEGSVTIYDIYFVKIA